MRRGETNQYYPAIYEGTTPLEPPATPEEGYHFTEDMTDRAIGWVRRQKAILRLRRARRLQRRIGDRQHGAVDHDPFSRGVRHVTL